MTVFSPKILNYKLFYDQKCVMVLDELTTKTTKITSSLNMDAKHGVGDQKPQ
jgi:hypothetical protein